MLGENSYSDADVKSGAVSTDPFALHLFYVGATYDAMVQTEYLIYHESSGLLTALRINMIVDVTTQSA